MPARTSPVVMVVPTIRRPGATDGRAIEVSIGTTTPAPGGGETVAVGGHPARFVTRQLPAGMHPRQISYVVVDLGLDLPLTVTGHGSWSRDDLLTTAEHVRVGPLPDFSWLGA